MPALHDLRFALRSLRRGPAFAATAIGTLALGIAVTTTIFSVVNGVLLHPLPYRDSSRLAVLWTTSPRQNAFERPTGYLNVQDWRVARSFESMAAFRDEPVVLREEPEPEPVEAAYVTPGFFDLLGVQPALGRFFTPAEAEHGDRLAVISYSLWQRRFGGSPDVLRRPLHVEGRHAAIVGVLPAGFRPLSPSTDLWMPHTAASFFDEIRADRSVKFGWHVLAKLRSGVALSQAQAEMDGIARRLAAEWPQPNRDSGVRVVSLLDQVTGRVSLALKLLMAAVALVLLIACANLGNLLLARAAGREREMAVRASLGASRAQLIGQLLTESAVIGLAGAALGFALAALGLRALLALAPPSVPRLAEVSLDGRTLAFTVALSLAAALLFGLTPAMRLAGRAIAPAQRSAGAGRSTRRLRDFLVVLEYAFAIVLLAGAGLLVRSLDSILRVDPGFRASRVLTVELHSPQNDPLTPPRFQQLIASIEALPGVEAAGGISRYFQANVSRSEIVVTGQPPQPAPMNADVIAGHYLQTIGVPLLRGRFFGPQDGPGAPAAVVVNAAFVRAFLPPGDPVGLIFHRAGDPVPYTIVGVVGDTRRREITSEPIPEMLWPHTQRPWGMNLAVRTQGDPLAMAAAVRGAIYQFERTAVVKSISTLDRQLDSRIAQRRFQTGLLAAFAALALLLAAIGIYGLMHYSVSERTREIGVRIALGARAGDVFAMVLRDAARLAVFGMLAGLGAALWLTRLLASLLYGVSAHDPLTYAAAFVVLATAALAASAVPARRATRCDPLTALRQE
ncbi:MAG TPA: ABC transporter permease [Candidatus Sulfopaludibacter sp.]|nr:ABC transporter permease [Candidatus Sulfopaludibacter sp.]